MGDWYKLTKAHTIGKDKALLSLKIDSTDTESHEVRFKRHNGRSAFFNLLKLYAPITDTKTSAGKRSYKWTAKDSRRRLLQTRRKCDSPVLIRLLEDIYRANGIQV